MPFRPDIRIHNSNRVGVLVDYRKATAIHGHQGTVVCIQGEREPCHKVHEIASLLSGDMVELTVIAELCKDFNHHSIGTSSSLWDTYTSRLSERA